MKGIISLQLRRGLLILLHLVNPFLNGTIRLWIVVVLDFDSRTDQIAKIGLYIFGGMSGAVSKVFNSQWFGKLNILGRVAQRQFQNERAEEASVIQDSSGGQ
jgi:hypothetical protein